MQFSMHLANNANSKRKRWKIQFTSIREIYGKIDIFWLWYKNSCYKQEWKMNLKIYKLKNGEKIYKKKEERQIISVFPLLPLDLIQYRILIHGWESKLFYDMPLQWRT